MIINHTSVRNCDAISSAVVYSTISRLNENGGFATLTTSACVMTVCLFVVRDGKGRDKK